mgnify:CR=1 FL=1|tara:strand:+ start:142 stop:1092 length:951 start_codon:yes stop_codon:yes gene_type:complete
MISRWIILLFIVSIPQGQDVIGEGLYGDELIEFLKENYETNTTLGYTNARDTLYMKIDRIDGQVMGVYTNYAVNLPATGVDPSTHLYENGMNCEHVWPQSLYEGVEPMKSDMHALRPCKENVNSVRGNKPFNEINDFQTTTWYWQDSQTSNIPSSNIDEYSENHGTYFEPREDRKGDVARTIFYFYTMYSNMADEDFFEIQKEVLQIWHAEDPVDANGIARTWQISEYQENKPNPFILDETLVERAYFYEECILGDLNGDSGLNVLDIVLLVNCVLANNCTDLPNGCEGDMNGDNGYNVLDVVILANCALEGNCFP